MPRVGLCLLLLAAAACNHQRDAREVDDSTPASAGDHAAWTPMPPVSNGVLSAELMRLDRGPSSVDALIRLHNSSERPLELRNLGDSLTGFMLEINGETFAADTHLHGMTVAAASLQALPPEAPVDLELHWRISPRQHRSDYPCSLIISNLFQDKKLADLIISVGPVPSDHPTKGNVSL
jgi:hypothetical protein